MDIGANANLRLRLGLRTGSGERRGGRPIADSEHRGSRRRSLVDRDLPQQVEVRQHLAGAEHDRRQRILGHRHAAGRSPRAGACRGSSAATRRRSATMPRSTMSADSSGGVRSSATRTASTMTLTVSASASRISSSVMVIVFGTPSIRCRPLISIVIRSSSGKAEPISILICSAVRSPMSRLYVFLMYWMIASSISLPATRTALL